MPKKEKKQPLTEVTWPIGPDGTYGPSPTDPMGMYTGRPMDLYEVPVQDADDL